MVHEPLEKPLNVVLVMVESLSASFMGRYGGKDGLTPRLDSLAGASLVFDRFYATGTRTTRGLEAVTLSLPPTPGRSIVKRIGRETGMQSLGHILGRVGYDVRFLYGGRAYFDNMGAFFRGNGYVVMDQSNVPNSEIGFENAWGMSDDDLFRTSLGAADQAAANGKPFFLHLMTTSNHRPYTYPEGRIDIPSGTCRQGAVKYSDQAIGDFIEEARTHPWFEDTLFVVVADHCASSAGKVDLPLTRYQIPCLIYGPKHVEPRAVGTLASQMDLAPTLLSMLGVSYTSTFLGRDILGTPEDSGRALIGTYQSLGFVDNGMITILQPRRESIQRSVSAGGGDVAPCGDPALHRKRCIAFYQGASHVFDHHLCGAEE